MRALRAMFLATACLAAASGARAAVTVLGPGPAQECFKIAEDGGDARDGIARCTFALDTGELTNAAAVAGVLAAAYASGLGESGRTESGLGESRLRAADVAWPARPER